MAVYIADSLLRRAWGLLRPRNSASGHSALMLFAFLPRTNSPRPLLTSASADHPPTPPAETPTTTPAPSPITPSASIHTAPPHYRTSPCSSAATTRSDPT